MSSYWQGSTIVIGAGASRAAVNDKSLSPPADIQFFSVAESLFRGNGGGELRRLGRRSWKNFLEYSRRAGISKAQLVDSRLEEIATYLESRKLLQFLQHQQGHPADISDSLQELKRLVCVVLVITGGATDCVLHKNLFEYIEPSSILSFNYDVIADSTLCRMGKLNWTSKEYCGCGGDQIPFVYVAGNRKGEMKKRKIERKNFERIPLYKLHGSMNWGMERGGRFKLFTNTEPVRFGGLDYGPIPYSPLMVPPVAAKLEVADIALKDIWAKARNALKASKSWIFWGYSMPQTDTAAMVMFRLALRNNKRPKKILVINPDFSLKQRLKKNLDKVYVEQHSTAEEYLLRSGYRLASSNS